MIIASILMHLSETKHGLIGIHPFNKYSRIFLWFDRIMAYICSLHVLYIMYYKWNSLTNDFILWGLFGLLMQMVSEIIVTNQELPLIITHCIWHYVAYDYYGSLL
jgi:hypothetical protein